MIQLYPYTPPKGATLDDILDRQVDNIKSIFLEAVPERTLNGYPIIVDMTQKTAYFDVNENISKQYPRIVLHLASSELHRQYYQKCNNAYPYSICCKKNIINKELDCADARHFITDDGGLRKICLQRLCRIHWIPKIIDLANSKNDQVKIINENNITYCIYSQNSTKHISYYLLILEKKRSCYVFKTAYPVTDKKSRNLIKNLLKK